MRRNHSGWARSLWSVLVAVAAVGLAASDAAAQTTINLVAAPFTKTVTLPDGTTVSVPMWGYALDKEHSVTVDGVTTVQPPNGILDVDEPVTVPGPRIVVPVGDTILTIKLTNLLPEATSLVIPGQPFTATPVRNADARVTAMTPETAPGAAQPYTFTGLKPGTFLYQSGSHPAVQVQMGLYGAMTQDANLVPTDANPRKAYPGVGFDTDVVLLFSEIDLALHQAVHDGTYGAPAGPTSTIDYRPSLFLINGESYTNEAAATLDAGLTGEVKLLRLLNAGLRTHAPVLDRGSLEIVAEDGNKLPFAKDQATVLLAAGKTHDALWRPGGAANAGVYSLYDRTLALNARGSGAGQGSAGMLVKLSVRRPTETGALRANPDTCSTSEEIAATACANVLANDTQGGANLDPIVNATAALVTGAHSGVVALNPDGTYTYTPGARFFGVDSFTYKAVKPGNESAPALVTITVASVANAPVAAPQSVGVDQDGNVSVTLGATDADGDALTYYLSTLPGHGALSYIDPVTKIETHIDLADLQAADTRKPIQGGLVIYTPTPTAGATPGYTGADSFSFVAFDGGQYSSAAQVSATVYPADADAPGADLLTPVTLAVVGADGSPIADYRWTLEEDLTYKVIPGVPDPNTLAVSFHKSYMPVVASGCVGTVRCDTPPDAQGIKVNPAKRYFVSVLPTEGTYSNSGAEIEAGQTRATITAAKLPLPTARIRVRVFQDNAPLNGMWDTDEAGLQNFQVTIDDAGGTYGMSGGPQSTDAFGNKIGTTYQECSDADGNPAPGTCDSYQVARLGDGFVLTDADGYAVIEHLVMGKYTVKVRAPGGDKWIQTTTIEGQPGIDAWVKPNEPQFFTEFGPPGPHVFVGFTRAVDGSGPLAALPGPWSTIKGRVTNLRQSRPIAVAQFSGAPFVHTRAWVALNSGATGGSLLYAQPTDADGTFKIEHVPSGSYQLMVFDSALDVIIGSTVVNVDAAAAATTDVHDVAVFSWFTNLYSFVFEDADGDGIHDAGEKGIPDQALNIRFRDGSIYQSLSTDSRGFKAFNEVFPFFAWQVAEVDYTRFHSTGLTVVVDGGGDAGPTSPNHGWRDLTGISLPEDVKKDLPAEAINPQPQPDNGGAPFRTESGAETPFLLLEGFQGFIGQSTLMMWGKAPYEKPGNFMEEVNVAPFDDFHDLNGNGVQDPGEPSYFPGPGDTDTNGDGFFNTDRSNGGIAGIIHYGITRAENDPRWAAAENWEPGVSDVRVQLWDADRTHLLNEVRTDNWNNSLPEGCQWPGTPYVYQGRTTDCFDGLRNFNQARPALFDGGYAFSTILQDSVGSPTYTLPIDQRGVARPLPAGKYVVKIIVPPGYRLQKEEDKNVDFGDSYVPQQFWLSGYPLADGGAGEAQPAPTVADSALLAPFCVGQLHEVPEELSLFPGLPGTYAGEMRPLCDAKLVTVRSGLNGAADFHLFTEAPVAGHIYGMVLDDTTNEFDPNAPTFGEKYAVPFIGVAIRDWQGREITRTYTDQYGMYNALVPSSYTANPPEPSGVSPSILAACINPPTMPGPGGTVVADPNFQKQYSHFCYPLQYLAGKTTYLDTPVLPTGAFTGNGTFPVDAELPDKTPVVAMVTGPDPNTANAAPDLSNPYGPYIVNRGPGGGNTPQGRARTILITSAASLTSDGLTEVANPAFDGTGGSQPKLIKRDYGFGSDMGRVTVDGTPLDILSWSNTQILARATGGVRTGQLVVERGAQSSCSVTLTAVSTLASAIGTANPSLTVAIGGGKLFASNPTIQIDAERMQVTGGNRSTLAADLGNANGTGAVATLARDTLRVPDGAASTLTAAAFPVFVSVEDEVMRLDGKSTTLVRTAQAANALTLNVTAATGTFFFAVGDLITVGSEVMLITSTAGNQLGVLRAQNGTTATAHAVNDPVVANDRFRVTRAVNGTTRAAHTAGLPVIGDVLTVVRAQEGTTAAAHSAGASVSISVQSCASVVSRKSTLGITLSVATAVMHALRPPTVVATGQSIQAAIDLARAGDLILVKPGVREEMVVMTKPIRLQGFGALSSAINVVTTPAENIQAWLDNMGSLLLASPAAGTPGSYVLPNQPAMTPAPFQSGDVAAVVGDEGPGVMVLGKFYPRQGETASGPLGNGRCRVQQGPNEGQDVQNNFVQSLNDAYCLHNENYEPANGQGGPAWRPNARIDGFSLIGASNAPGVLVNGYARQLEVSNNKIFTNSGTYAGGIQIGHVGAPAPFADQDAQNDNVEIHNNMITQNAGSETGGGGGVVLGTGSTNYVVKNNFIAANFTAGNGGGISHIGLSQIGTIDGNTVIFNESFAQAVGTNGGGIFIGGTPAAAGASTPGSGVVEVTNNLIQGNAASGGDGGGVALRGFSASDHVGLYNNVIANNVAGLAGGGISLEGLSEATVDIVHDTVVHNDSTGTAGAAFTAGPLTSVPQPAGIAGRGPIPNVRIANSIVWDNRTFYFGPCATPACGVIGPPGAAQFGEIQDPARVFWDLGVLGGSAFSPISSVISGPTDSTSYAGPGTGNTSVAPAFVASYFNGDRRTAYQIGETNGEATLISAPAALDEGGNFIRPQFGPLSLETTNSAAFFGNYHLTGGVGGAALGSLYGTVPDPLATDFDSQSRPLGAPHRGADEVVAPVPAAPVPQR